MSLASIILFCAQRYRGDSGVILKKGSKRKHGSELNASNHLQLNADSTTCNAKKERERERERETKGKNERKEKSTTFI